MRSDFRLSASRPSFLGRLLVAASVVALAALAVSPRGVQADPDAPRTPDRQVTLAINTLLKHEHLSRRDLDDEISQRGLVEFLKMLDPWKVYFYQSDVDEFMKHKTELDDQVRRGDLSYGYHIFKRFLERVDERVATAEELLAGKFDFTRDEELITDADEAVYPANPAEAKDRWRKRLKYDLLVLKAEEEEESAEEAVDRLKRRYRNYARRMHQTDEDELMEMYITAMTSSYDPHTTYMSPSTLENFNIQMGLKLEGIGAALQVDDGYTVVNKIIPGGAADKEGSLEHEDRIVSVGQDEDGEMVDVVDMKLSDVVKLIRGPAGTIVRLGVKKPGGTDLKTVKITRAKIELKDSEARGVVLEAGKKPGSGPFKVGVINLPSFYMDMDAARDGLTNFKSTSRDVQKILEDFRGKGVDAVVLDLRRNGGGSLTEAIKLTGLFIDRGPVVQVKNSEGRIQHYDDLDSGMAWDGPLVVLTSKLSASASEILAGAIQDYRRGLVVGDATTHGKGTVQSLMDIGSRLFRVPHPPNLGALKITMQQFYRPSGDSTQKRGVLPDIVLPALTSHMDIGESDLDYAIDFDRVPKTAFDDANLVTGEIIRTLTNNSKERIGASEDFSKLLAKIVRYREQKARKRVPLNEQKFMERRKEFDADKEEEKTLLDEENGDKESKVVDRDYYFEEVLSITADYLRLLEESKLAVRRR